MPTIQKVSPMRLARGQVRVSCQAVPEMLAELMTDTDRAKVDRTPMTAVLKMKKLDIVALQKAHAG